MKSSKTELSELPGSNSLPSTALHIPFRTLSLPRTTFPLTLSTVPFSPPRLERLRPTTSRLSAQTAGSLLTLFGNLSSIGRSALLHSRATPKASRFLALFSYGTRAPCAPSTLLPSQRFPLACLVVRFRDSHHLAAYLRDGTYTKIIRHPWKHTHTASAFPTPAPDARPSEAK